MSLLRRTARVAVASSVHGRVQRRQQSRWAAEDQAAAAQHAVQPAVVAPVQPVVAPPVEDATALSVDVMIEQLTKLGELHRSGVLTDAEFDAQKALLLSRPRA